tara:strand:+ start:2978 stop:5068 length:2091 start_codon:yes stop_codon:yes gene_type:complete
MPLDITSAEQAIQSKIDAYKTYREIAVAQKKLLKEQGNSISAANSQITSQLNKIQELQKRFQRNPPNSMDNLLNFLGLTQGTGGATAKYLRTKILEAAAQIEPSLVGILKEETIKALGCSVEQTYTGFSLESLDLTPIPLRPQAEGIYIPVNSLDFFSSLKQSPQTNFGKVYYEKEDPSADPIFLPYGGEVPFPMNKQLFDLMTQDNAGRTYKQINGKYYLGKSEKPLYDLQYTNVNSFGVTGDYYRVFLIDRKDEETGEIVNNVGQFISDYYSTIKLVDTVDIGAQIVNLISGAIDYDAQFGVGQLDDQSKFALIAQRILGLCFDNRTEIDVSGVSKIAELDGVDNSFFELNEIDLRNIEVQISNVQNGVMEFEDCGNIRLPVDSTVLMDELINFRDSESGDTTARQVEVLSEIIDSISDNPSWSLDVPTNLNVKLSIDKNVIKKIPLAIFAAVLTPKTLLPLYTLLSVVQSATAFTYNQVVTEVNQNIDEVGNLGASVGTQGSNIINNSEDFLKKYRTFCIEVLSRINVEFLKVLYDILKKDIINLTGLILKDLIESKLKKKYTIINSLVAVTLAVSALVGFVEFRKCKSLMDNILFLLNLANKGLGRQTPNEIPLPLLLLSGNLPGYSPERATINAFELLQSVGIPTGTLPDGSPNLMGLYTKLTNQAVDKEESENGKVEIAVAGLFGIGKKL